MFLGEIFFRTDGELYSIEHKIGVIVIKINYSKKLNPIYIESVEASLLHIGEVASSEHTPVIQWQMGNKWINFEKIYTREAVLNDSLFLRFMQKSITRNSSDFCKDFIVVKFTYPAKYKVGEVEHTISQHDLRNYYYSNGVTFLSGRKISKKKKQQDTKQDIEPIHYKMLYRSPGKAKKGECVFIRESLFHKAINFLTMGLYDLMSEKAKADPEAVFKLVELSAYLSLSTATAAGYLRIPLEQILVVEDEKVLSAPKIAEVVSTKPVEYYGEEFVLNFDDPRMEKILNKHECTLYEDKAQEKGWRLIKERTKEELKKNGIRINGKFPGEKKTVVEKIFQECIVSRQEEEIENILWDGMGLIDESIFPRYAEGFVYCRSHFFKSCLFRGNVQEYLKDFCIKNDYDFDTYVIKDMFGNEKKLSEIKVVITDKSLKWLKFVDLMGGTKQKAYEMYRHYMKERDDYFSVVKYAHKSKWGALQLTAYQMNNSLPTTDEKVLVSITEEAVKIINSLKTDNTAYLKYLDWKKDNFNINEVLCELVKWNPSFLKTEFFRDKKSKDISGLKADFKEGRLPQHGDNLTICGNPIALLMKAVGENPLDEKIFQVKEDAIQCYTNRFPAGTSLAAFRNPHNSPNNILHLHNIHSDIISKYFPQLGDNVIIINLIGTDAQARGSGFDEDSDFILVTDHKEMSTLAKEAYINYPTIINKVDELKSSEYHFRLEDFADMDNKIADAQTSIGTSTDTAQLALSYYYDEGMNNRELEEIFIILSVIGQISIDLAKKEFDLDVVHEIKRLKNSECMKGKPVPQFFANTKKRRNNKDFAKVEKMDCPMDIMANLIEKNIIGYAGRESHEPIRKLLNKSSNEKVNRYKCNKVIEEAKKYNDAVKALETDRRLGKVKDDLYFQLKRKLMSLFLSNVSKNLNQETVRQLINHALKNENADIMTVVFNYLYSNYKDYFMNCFVKSA